ncbi:hypothetical protein DPMN_179544 [Dreissena polymorpha]|uniref:Uncharacterized protein n=1 Tax=Dreissena polymorpha TaxID=45954 RepID=A0A9D4EGA6_DREPO|nr:hypothetical protein DPMN_179544 [Dreissena polymorpha]
MWNTGGRRSSCQELMTTRNVYIQAINYTTVALGKELLRIAPTPYHNTEMMDDLVEKLVIIW